MSAGQIDAVLLIGDSAELPGVRETIASAFGRPVAALHVADTAALAAYGAAIAAAENAPMVWDVTPYPLGINCYYSSEELFSPIIAANTPHNRFDAITRGLRLPVVSIFEAVARECARLGIREMLVLGTALTMQSPVFPAVLARFGVRALAPESAEERAKVLAIIAELYAERAVNAAARIREVVDRVMPATGAERAVCLGCTELPLAFPAIEREASLVVGDVRYLNSTIIHAREAFAALEG
jgi:aspartate racemase